MAARKKGIRLCVDLSATPFYIQGSGNEVGKPLPWVVSDFGLLDAIESGLVKVPQLPTRDITGAEEASYFNVWRWVEHRAEKDGHGTKLTPELVMTYATAPINQLAQDWHARFLEWQKQQAGELHPVPPVFIVVCRDTKVAGAVYDWLADGKGAADAPPWFRNAPGQEMTVRIDSKVVEDMEEGGTKDETRRLRFILDTVGKKTWPGGKVPEEWSELVRKNNEKAANGDQGEDEDGDAQVYRWIDERIPPGRDIRCIVSVAMLAEGWDANTVTHIVGLRPFGSQLLCEQVVGRALRRLSYALNEETDQFEEETAKVFGVPFELVPFKVRKVNGQPPPPPPKHIFSVPEKAGFEIEFPLVEGYFSPGRVGFHLDWAQIPSLTLDPMEIPDRVQLNSLTAPGGRPIRLWSWRQAPDDPGGVAGAVSGAAGRLPPRPGGGAPLAGRAGRTRRGRRPCPAGPDPVPPCGKRGPAPPGRPHQADLQGRQPAGGRAAGEQVRPDRRGPPVRGPSPGHKDRAGRVAAHPQRLGRTRLHRLRGLPHHQAHLPGGQVPPQRHGGGYQAVGAERGLRPGYPPIGSPLGQERAPGPAYPLPQGRSSGELHPGLHRRPDLAGAWGLSC